MPSNRPRLLRRRDLFSNLIIGVFFCFNVLTCVLYFFSFRRSIRSHYQTIRDDALLTVSNCVNSATQPLYVKIRQLTDVVSSVSSCPTVDPETQIIESPDDVVGVYGYGQTRSQNHIWIYRDDKLRDGRSRRVYLKKLPLDKP